MNILLKIKLLRGFPHTESISRRHLRDISDCLTLPDSYLLKNCGIHRALFHHILRILEPVVPKTKRSNGIPFTLKILVTLSFLANGSHQKYIGKDFNISISQKSVSRVMKIVIEGLNEVLNEWVIFPSTVTQRDHNKEGFYKNYNFPETIGCLDGTFVEIVCPSDDEEIFFDRNGHYSIHAQIICDADTRIIGICCRFGGSASNTFIWNKMNIRPFIENISRQGESSWLIADHKYPQRAWLMTPIQHTQGTPDSQYNHLHGQTKTCIDRCISKLKGRWHCLHKRPLHYSPQRAAKIINACAILHNLCITAGLPDPELYQDPQLPVRLMDQTAELPGDNVNDLYVGMEIRKQLAERLYYST